MADFLRQLDIVNPDQLVYPVTMIGLGGIGSFTAETLRKMGFRNFTLFDGDEVEAHNVPCQNFDASEVGQSKADSTAARLHATLGDDATIGVMPRRFTATDELEGIVIAGVDSMTSRKAIWQSLQNGSRALVPLYIDGRVGVAWDEENKRVKGEWIEVFAVNPSSLADIQLYESHLFDSSEAAPLRCTAQEVVYVGTFIASFITATVKRWVVGEKFPRYLLFDCLTFTVLGATT